VSRGQLAALAVTAQRIHRLTVQGWLTRVHQGFYRVGTLTPDGVLWAALLAMGPGTVLTNLTAGHEHTVLRGRRAPRSVDVTAPTRRRRRDGVRPHCSRLDPRDITIRRGLAFTTLARTLLDLAAVLPERELQASRSRSTWCGSRSASRSNSTAARTTTRTRRSRRSRRHAAIGWEVVRATWLDLEDRPAELAADVWAVLRAQGL